MEALAFELSDQGLLDRYDALFENCPNAFIQQSRYWAEVIQDLGPDKPIFLICQDQGEDIAGLPLYLYEHQLGNILTSVPQPGPMGGIFLKDKLSAIQIECVYQTLINAALALATRYRCMALTVISHPFLKDLEYYERFLSPTFVMENFTQYLPLNDPQRRSHGHRNNLNKTRKAGYRVTFCETEKELLEWYSIHQKRHEDLGIEALNYRIFENLFHVLRPRKKANLRLVYAEDRIVSGGWYIYHRNVMDVFMLSMISEELKAKPNFLNTDASIVWAREKEIERYNWQSSPGRESGVYHYKKQWGSIEKEYYFVTKLLCPPEKIKNIGLERMKVSYPQHYVVPYGVFDQGFNNKYFKKG